MDEEKPNKPSSSAFKQQKIKSWAINLSPKALGIFYIVAGCIFLMIGIIIMVESNDVIEHKMRYDNKDACEVHWKHPESCTLKLHLSEKMESPIFIYYEISNMYQNHRQYNKNRDIEQLMGNSRSKNDIKPNCFPVSTIRDLGLYIDNPHLSPKSVASPCGLIAKSKFNDTYSIAPTDPKKDPVKISFNDISWSFDRNDKFKNHDRTTKMWTDIEDRK